MNPKGNDLVHWSVFEANQKYGKREFARKVKCSKCGRDTWTTQWDVREEFKSAWNPGECIWYICSSCGLKEGPFSC